MFKNESNRKRNFLKIWAFLTGMMMIFISIFPEERKLSVLGLIFSFPLWSYGKSQIFNSINGIKK